MHREIVKVLIMWAYTVAAIWIFSWFVMRMELHPLWWFRPAIRIIKDAGILLLLLSLAGLVTAIAGIFHQYHIGNRDAEIWAMNTAVWCLVSVLGAIVNILQKGRRA